MQHIWFDLYTAVQNVNTDKTALNDSEATNF